MKLEVNILRIQHNISAMTALRNLSKKTNRLEKLSSGFRINRAADDAAGLSISEKMRAQICTIQKAQGNTQDAVSLLQTADGALSEVHVMLRRMRELSIQSSNSTYTEDERQAMQAEIEHLKSDIDRISESTSYNQIPLLDGSLSSKAAGTEGTAAQTGFYQADIDFTNVKDNASIEIDGVTVEFDTDGIQSIANSVMADISIAADHASRAQAFQNAVLASDLVDRYDISFGNTASGMLHMELTAKSGAGTIPVAFHALPPTGGPLGVEIIDPDPSSYIAIYTVSDVDINKIVDGTTIKINDKLFEFDKDGTVNNPAATSIDFNERIDIHRKFNDAVQAVFSDYLITMTADSLAGSSDIYRIEAFYFGAPAPPITNIDINPPHTEPYLFEGTNVSNSPAGEPQQTVPSGIIFQIGSSANETMQLFIEGSSSSDLGVHQLSLQNNASANQAVLLIDRAINKVSQNRAGLGAVQNRLERTMSALGNSAENLSSAESRIRDVDMAREMMGHVKDGILSQAAQAMLTQANHLPEDVLQLLK